jgi:pimeloyl-ACP methyl ester carboxylesterase
MTLFTLESGPVDAKTIVLLHGGGSASWMWRPVIERLSEFHCLAPDLPGHGKSVDQVFSMAEAAKSVAGLIRARAHGGTAHVVGLSLGAQVLVLLLSQSPDVVGSAVISSALLHPLPGSSLGVYSAFSAKAVYWSAIAPLKGWDAWIRLNMKYSAGIPDAFFNDFKHDFRQLNPDNWANVMVENARFRIPPGLGHVKSPVLVLAGQGEYQVMRKSAQDLVDALPNATFLPIPAEPGWSLAQQHNWALTAPDRFACIVREWVHQTKIPAKGSQNGFL